MLSLSPTWSQSNEYYEDIWVEPEPVDYVDPFIGTGGHGHTFPGPTMPFGMVQLSPDTRLDGWDGCSGYHYSDTMIYGFSHTHLSGTGVSDYGDVLIRPFSTEDLSQETFGPMRFQKGSETAYAGFYGVFLIDEGIRTELATTYRTGIHKYRYFKPKAHNGILIDLEHRDQWTDCDFMVVDSNTIMGHRVSNAWAQQQHIYFCLRTSINIKAYEVNAERTKTILDFGEMDEGQTLVVKVGISAVDEQGALKNLETEAATWSFGRYVSQGRQTWNAQLSKIRVEGGTDEMMEKFYTALYHTMIAPNLFSDVDGRYRGTDLQIHQTDPNYPQFTVFSLWDTFRAAHPLYTIIEPTRTDYFLQTFLRQYRDGGQLPVWELAGTYTGCMIGYHSVSVIADAATKGLINKHQLPLYLDAMKTSADQTHLGLRDYRTCAYIPAEKEHESVSKTLEYAYDDWCIAQVAKLAGQDSVYDRFINRAQFYKNIFDPQTGFMRPRTNGNWKSHFDPREVNFNFTEANSWQYSYFAPHDVSGLIELHGGKDRLGSHIDSMFSASTSTTGRDQADITGLIGQYAHGNEPSHHIPFLFHYLNKPQRTQEIVNTILDSLYTVEPDGLSGNEDCGQMSAWFVMAAMGLYQVNPGQPEYVIFKPAFDRITIRDEHEQWMTISKAGSGDYVSKVNLNNQAHTKSYITHEQLKKGTSLAFLCSEEPGDWGTSDADIPVSSIPANERIVRNPTIVHDGLSFVDKSTITITHPHADAVIKYTIGDGGWQVYSGPIDINETTVIQAMAEMNGTASRVEHATVHLRDASLKIELKEKYDNQYTGGGDLALIDGIRGGQDFRTEAWQGYQGVDLFATVDLGNKRKLNMISLGCLQDIKSWIWFPKDVVFEYSKNGKDFLPLARYKYADLPTDMQEKEGAFRHDFKVAGPKKKVRYIRVKASNYGVNPSWHVGAGGKTWLFVDEILVQ